MVPCHNREYMDLVKESCEQLPLVEIINLHFTDIFSSSSNGFGVCYSHCSQAGQNKPTA